MSNEQELMDQRVQDREDFVWAMICKTPIGVPARTVSDNIANRCLIFGWLHEDQGEIPSVTWFKKIISEPGLKEQVAWQRVLTQRETARQLEKDRETFAKAARNFRISENEANFGLIRSILGENFSLYQVQQAIDSGAIQLSAASQEELEAYRREAVEERRDFLVNTASLDQLKAAVRQEAADSRAVIKQQEADEALQSTFQREAHRNFQPLPGEITSALIKQATPEQIKLWMRKWGSANVTARLRGLA